MPSGNANASRKGRKKWTFALVKADAEKYTSVTEWVTFSRGSYKAALRNRWFDECKSHMERKDRVSVVYKGVKYDSVIDCLLSHGVAPTRGECSKVVGGNIRKMMRDESITREEAIDRVLNRKRMGSMAERRHRKLQTEESRRRSQNQRKMELFWQQSFFTAVKPCAFCGRFGRSTARVHFCNIECSEEYRKIVKTNTKKSRGNGKIAKRHRKYGTKWESGITAATVAKRFKMKCQLCLRRVEPHEGKGWQPLGWTIGHIIPVADGGATTWSNVQCECFECNTAKGKRVMNRHGQYGLVLHPSG